MSIIGAHRRFANAALLVVLSFVCGLTAADLNDWYAGRDFHCFWAAGRIVASGGDPYDPQQYLPVVLTMPPSEQKALDRCGQRLVYPPWTALALAPFGALPLPAAATAWASLGVMATVLGIYWTWELAARRRFSWPLVAVLVVATEPFARNFVEGQFGAFSFALTAGAALALLRKNDGTSGISTAALALKPHTAVVFTAAMLGLAILRRRWRFVVASGAVALGVIALCQLLRPGWLLEFVGGAMELSGSIGARATIWSLAGSWTLAAMVIALLLAGVIVLIRRRGVDDAEFLGLSVSFGLVVTPYAWDHDYIVLAIPWCMIISHARQLRPWLRSALTMSTVIVAGPVLTFLAGVLTQVRATESQSVIVPVATTLLLALAIRLEETRAT